MQSIVALASVSSAQGPPKAANGGTLVQTAVGSALFSLLWMLSRRQRLCWFPCAASLPALASTCALHKWILCFIRLHCNCSCLPLFKRRAQGLGLTCALTVRICSALLSPVNHSRFYNSPVLHPQLSASVSVLKQQLTSQPWSQRVPRSPLPRSLLPRRQQHPRLLWPR